MVDDAERSQLLVRFPTTHWSMIEAVRGPMSPEQREVLNVLIGRYWKPVYAYIVRRGFRDGAADLAQDFFVHALQRELFGRADQARGRFRTFLLACLNNFLADVGRRQRVKMPVEGIVSIEQLATERGTEFEPAEDETPEAAFYRTWVRELLLRVWEMLDSEFATSGQTVHAEIFRQRVLTPILDSGEPPAMAVLARQFALAEKQACNCLVTARRAFQRLLREEIAVYATSDEEIAAEINDLFRFAAEG